ncbi:uridine 5'-monophosphate synthase/orotate phosphoribosyltransferase [Vararia minispora EC-137]|uniref:Uridine 5'-monophosphate synthase/orotate phosphoribosyltransferase n=1 Tax=Vararia minispora EC-137 TaxID=1314806 RepID=A0ACB8QR15_9AGAM|nr:uridine 5'-monophosphate synthase/orotate phosphoribosyltransferase [Vararia minispora EC-137]
MSSTLEKYQIDLIDGAMAADALKFGSFTLKSGRISPYFFNAGLLSSGPLLSALCGAYASTIATALSSSSPTSLPHFDVIFGPAYKGIALAGATAILLHMQHGIDVGFAYDRKEAKDHGEGGKMVGVPVQGKRVLILDDVMTAGTAVRNSIAMINEAGGQVVGVIMCLDREEVGREGQSTAQEVEAQLGGAGRVRAILRMRDLMKWLEEKERTEELQSMQAYWEKFGVKA